MLRFGVLVLFSAFSFSSSSSFSFIILQLVQEKCKLQKRGVAESKSNTQISRAKSVKLEKVSFSSAD